MSQILLINTDDKEVIRTILDTIVGESLRCYISSNQPDLDILLAPAEGIKSAHNSDLKKLKDYGSIIVKNKDEKINQDSVECFIKSIIEYIKKDSQNKVGLALIISKEITCDAYYPIADIRKKNIINRLVLIETGRHFFLHRWLKNFLRYLLVMLHETKCSLHPTSRFATIKY